MTILVNFMSEGESKDIHYDVKHIIPRKYNLQFYVVLAREMM